MSNEVDLQATECYKKLIKIIKNYEAMTVVLAINECLCQIICANKDPKKCLKFIISELNNCYIRNILGNLNNIDKN